MRDARRHVAPARTQARPKKARPRGQSQRQLRAGELVRHALVEILREEDLQDPALAGVSVTVTEVRMSARTCATPSASSSRSAACTRAEVVAGAEPRRRKFLRGRLGHAIELKIHPGR